MITIAIPRLATFLTNLQNLVLSQIAKLFLVSNIKDYIILSNNNNYNRLSEGIFIDSFLALRMKLNGSQKSILFCESTVWNRLEHKIKLAPCLPTSENTSCCKCLLTFNAA